MAAAIVDDHERDYWLYDTFEGMQGVSEYDYREGKHATESSKWRKGGHEGSTLGAVRADGSREVLRNLSVVSTEVRLPQQPDGN